jgi:hypothetical protein
MRMNPSENKSNKRNKSVWKDINLSSIFEIIYVSCAATAMIAVSNYHPLGFKSPRLRA